MLELRRSPLAFFCLLSFSAVACTSEDSRPKRPLLGADAAAGRGGASGMGGAGGAGGAKSDGGTAGAAGTDGALSDVGGQEAASGGPDAGMDRGASPMADEPTCENGVVLAVKVGGQRTLTATTAEFAALPNDSNSVNGEPGQQIFSVSWNGNGAGAFTNSLQGVVSVNYYLPNGTLYWCNRNVAAHGIACELEVTAYSKMLGDDMIGTVSGVVGNANDPGDKLPFVACFRGTVNRTN